jgi:hypothetical protein
MPRITTKNIPDELYRCPGGDRSDPHRSLAKEIVVALTRHVGTPTQDKQALLERIRAVRRTLQAHHQ